MRHWTCSSCEGPRASQCSACTAHKCTATGLCPTSLRPFFDLVPRRDRDAAARWQLGRCLSACPAGRYGGADGVCRTCDAACRECDGPTNKHCTAPGGLPGARKRRAAADAHCADGATLMGFGCELPGRCAEGRYLVKPEAPPVSTFAIFGGKAGAAVRRLRG